MKELTIRAERAHLHKVLAFVDEILEEAGCTMKAQMQIAVALEEIFVNIASYAYGPEGGDVKIRVEIRPADRTAVITLIDHGIPYDPTKKEDPDITLSAEERTIGGLGIFMMKKSMDHVRYEYVDGQNVLVMEKALG